ncbi:MAG: hypothetical protein GY928_29985 [Colwellia sp.]|nr:hypothetical protein [Colwellia sp.]
MNKYKCRQCGDAFTSYNPKPMYCSLQCKGDHQAPNINIDKLKKLYLSGKTQSEVGEILNVSQKSIHKAMKRHKIKARVAKKRNQYGENNDSWKGDEAGYAAFHRRLYSKYGKPTKCSVCGTKSSSNYDYANLTGNYHDIDDYAPMCRSCHWKYDKTILNIKHMRDREVKKNVGE